VIFGEEKGPQAISVVSKDFPFLGLGGDRWFESASLQRRVWCEPGFRSVIWGFPSTPVNPAEQIPTGKRRGQGREFSPSAQRCPAPESADDPPRGSGLATAAPPSARAGRDSARSGPMSRCVSLNHTRANDPDRYKKSGLDPSRRSEALRAWGPITTVCRSRILVIGI
jgi:hypothetical protein